MSFLPLIDKFLSGGAVGKILDFIPNVNERREHERELRNTLIEFASSIDEAQNAVNLEQAKHDSLFVAGARPFAMWGAAICFFYTVGGVPLLQNVLEIFMPMFDQPVPTLTKLDTEEVRPLLYGLLGLGGFRMGEKMMGVSRESLELKPGLVGKAVDKVRNRRGKRRQKRGK